MAKIYFADGVDCRITLQEGASVGDALAAAAARLDVKRPHARFLAIHAASATGAVEAAPLGRATALANGGRLVILVRLWTSGLRAAVEEDAALRDLAFRQARCCAQGDTWPCPVRDGARAAAAQLQLVDGSAPPLSLAEVRAALPRCLSRRVLRARALDDWAVDVVLELGARRRDPRADAARDFLALAATWPAFGTVAFRATAGTPARLAGRRVVLRAAVRKSTSASGQPGGIIYYSGRLDAARECLASSHEAS